jgi:hypothetical protein
LQANQKLGDSIYGLNSSAKQEAFQRKKYEFIFSSILTTGFFLGSSVVAYIRFGRDTNWNDLNINNREDVSIEKFRDKLEELKSGQKIELNYEQSF